MLVSVVVVAAMTAPRACDSAALKGSVLCDPSKPMAERAEWIVSRLTVDEKVNLTMNTGWVTTNRSGLLSYNWCSEGLHGVANAGGVHFTAATPYATSYPQVITTASSFNRSLYQAVSKGIAIEARSFNNAGTAGLTYWAPNVNIFRDPRWGRGQETPGEDPYLTANYAEWFINGMQHGEEDRSHLKASSCCKHYYGYSREKNRSSFDATFNLQDEADSYLPAFHSCVVNANVSGLMCSYAAVNGTPSCVNSRIMTEIARDTWKFDGYITSDCNAVQQIVDNHHYEDADEAVRDTLGAGMDSECGSYFFSHMKSSLDKGVTNIAAVDTALVRLFIVQIRLGMFDPADGQPFLGYTWADNVNTKEHQNTALSAAHQGTVLLKNDGTLPLSKDTIKTVAVVGPNANATLTLLGDYHGVAPFMISPVEGLGMYANTTLAEGCADCNCVSTEGFADAVDAAKGADATVMVVGISHAQEDEGHDRTTITFPGEQEKLFADIAEAAKGPVIAVVFGGGSLDMSSLKKNPKVHAILWMGYPGQSGGQALADVVFGAFNPGGRMVTTQYPADYVHQASVTDFAMRPGRFGYPGRTYRFYTGEPVYSFGEGMSYTTFSYTAKTASTHIAAADVQAACDTANVKRSLTVTAQDAEMSTVTVDVKNTGSVDGDATVLIFAIPPQSTGAPKKFLVGFERVTLMAGATQSITFPLYYTAFSLVNTAGMHEPVVGGWKIDVGYDAAATVGFTVTN